MSRAAMVMACGHVGATQGMCSVTGVEQATRPQRLWEQVSLWNPGPKWHVLDMLGPS